MANPTPPPPAEQHPRRDEAARDPAVRACLAALEGLQGTLQVARALVSAGRTVELDGLEQEAGRLCVAVATLPLGARPLLHPPLLSVLREVEALRAELAPA